LSLSYLSLPLHSPPPLSPPVCLSTLVIISLRLVCNCFSRMVGSGLCRFPKRPWSKFITAENKKYVSEEALSFLDGLLRYDHQVPSPIPFLPHPLFLTPTRQWPSQIRFQRLIPGTINTKRSNGTSLLQTGSRQRRSLANTIRNQCKGAARRWTTVGGTSVFARYECSWHMNGWLDGRMEEWSLYHFDFVS
jgi:hypothetical protein